MTTERITDYHAKYFAYELTRQRRGGDVDRLAASLFDASVDLNPHRKQWDGVLPTLHRRRCATLVGECITYQP